MGGTFNPQILAEKLAKLNNSQQSIETLSHWCIFHMSKAKLVVETWDRQFHCSPREQRLAFLYLANDILQNSRRKGSEFVVEFWKVLPEALRDMIENGDDFGRNAAMRLIGIWEDRKVFGSRGQILKEEFVHRPIEKKDGKHFNIKLKHGFGNIVDKVVAGYQAIYGGEFDEDVIIRKCENATIFVEKVAKEINGSINSEGKQREHEHEILEELQGQQDVLKDCVEQLEAVESSRASLVIHLREALQEQEVRLGQIHSQLLTAQVHSKRAGDMCQRLASGRFASVYNTEESTIESNVGNSEDDSRRHSAAEMVARLTASTSSAEMLSFVLSSLASEGILVNGIKDVPVDYPLEKRPKTEDKNIAYMPTPSSLHEATNELPPPPPPSSSGPLPPPPPLLPPMVPYGMPQLGQAGASMPGLPYGYVMNHHHQQPLSHPGMPMLPATAMSPFPLLSTSSYQQVQVSGSGFYDQQSSYHSHLSYSQ